MPKGNGVACLDYVDYPGIQARSFPPFPKALEPASDPEDFLSFEEGGWVPGGID